MLVVGSRTDRAEMDLWADRRLCVSRSLERGGRSYKRRLELYADAERVDALELFTDTGGYSRVNVFGSTPKRGVVIATFDEVYEVSTERFRPLPRSGHAASDGTFLGAFDVDRAGRWRFISANEAPLRPTERRGG